ncbi:lytic transglycosylase domain-containing protein [uncultured Prevotella sp.]|uniref:lytic transglycosylase domain-containing protein n=1 Tax=uncultured Prevotella sp. TaxID=159272 RepID=UPI002583CAED|nr:lytic transglycosylase domain-containing protein [uncultured Prevotella sp.]
MGNKEEIDFPEAMTYDMDSLMSQYMSKTYLATDNDCQMKNENVTYDKQVYIDRLHRMPTIMEMPYNEVVQSCIDRYTSRMRQSVSYFLGASNFYMPIFEEALDLYQLPLELKYLPVIESALNPTAVSRVGATGLWQFMLTTGKAYGLNVNTLVDERRDPVKASYAAARYLRDLYNIFGDWNLVIAAYNCGPENINKAIRRSGGEKDYWKIYPYLPKETRGYVPAFIAANYVMNYYCEHNICPMKSQLPVKTDTVMVDRNVNFSQIASVCGLDISMIRALNPAYRRDIVPGATTPSPIRLPISDISTFIDRQDSIYAAESSTDKRLEVPVEETVVKTTTAKDRKSSRNAQWHKVRSGDNLGAIARRYGTTVSKLKKLNGLRNSNIRAGQRLRVR